MKQRVSISYSGDWSWLSCPTRRPEIRTLPQNDDLLMVASHAEDRPVAMLNETARKIWLMSDGLTSVQAMAGRLGWQYDIAQCELESQVLQAVIQLHELRLLQDPIVRTDLMRLVFTQGSGVGMGFFAAFHYIWEMLGQVDEHWARQVKFWDDQDTDIWPELFHSDPADVEPPGGRVFEAHLGDFKRYSQAPADLYRQDGEPAVSLHPFPAAKQGDSAKRYPNGQQFQQRFKDQRARTSMYLTVSRVIRPNQTVISECANFSQAEFSDSYILGVHLRSARYLGVDLPSRRYIREWVIPEIEDTLASQGQSDGRVFIATDQSEYVELCRGHFGDRMLVRAIPRVTHAWEDWYQLGSKRLDIWRNVLIDALLLAKCNFVMGFPSNVLSAVLIFNPHNDFKIFDFALERSEEQVIFPRPKSADKKNNTRKHK